MSEHSPLPWEVLDRRNAPLKNIKIMSGFQVVGEVAAVHQRDHLAGYREDRDSVVADVVDELGLANAGFIVTACNSHYAQAERIKALEDALAEYVTFHSGHVLPDGLGATQTRARALLEKP